MTTAAVTALTPYTCTHNTRAHLHLRDYYYSTRLTRSADLIIYDTFNLIPAVRHRRVYTVYSQLVYTVLYYLYTMYTVCVCVCARVSSARVTVDMGLRTWRWWWRRQRRRRPASPRIYYDNNLIIGRAGCAKTERVNIYRLTFRRRETAVPARIIPF